MNVFNDITMEGKNCQSCGMPMHAAEDFGTNADGTMNIKALETIMQNPAGMTSA